VVVVVVGTAAAVIIWNLILQRLTLQY